MRRGVTACLILGFVLVGPTATAACCALDHLTIKAPSADDGFLIEGDVLDRRLEDWEMSLLSWPVFNNMSKASSPPPGDLGPVYLVTYVHDSADGGARITARESLYPYASPDPVAYTHPGQSQDFVRSDGVDYPIAPGWRPFQPTTAAVLLQLLEEEQVGETGSGGFDLGLRYALLLLAIGVVAHSLRLRSALDPLGPK